MMTSLKRGSVTTEHSCLRLSALADYAQLLSIYSIFDNCVRESALWLRALDFYPGGPGSIPTAGVRFFQLCFIPLLRLSGRKMGARPALDFIRRKWLHVIINDDFLEKGECYDRALLPSIICLGRLRIASKYIFNL